jgi:hypothetical protein
MNEELWSAVAMVVLLAVALIALWAIPGPRYVRIDCSTVEFNPDMTPEVRKKCRELRATKY